MYRQTAQTSNLLLPKNSSNRSRVARGFGSDTYVPVKNKEQILRRTYTYWARRKADVNWWNMTMNYKDTELTLGLPGGGSRGCSTGVVVFGELMKSSMKRGFMDTDDDLNNLDLESSNGDREPRGQAKLDDGPSMEAAKYSSSSTSTTAVKAPTAKGQVVGWPPVRSTRNKALDSKNLKNNSSSKYVKVGADGAPYLRKVDLEMYKSYEELLTALEKIFTSFTINGKYMEDDRKQQMLFMEHAVVNGTVEYNQYVLTYEDKDNDWMLVGDVPWNIGCRMFKDSCKRIRLMKSSEAAVRN
ncbi:auxin-responsive protein IAA1 isoform X1 [Rosa chinensis]|uniref:auxin-responsive protein IAA1 isoform X1 n=2 Tax=Rosa chinensis TaxID=74649 RepID=UPI000D088043|nr:auxin-responsive protein IAA1 isoform X1 [Rosa chinensis]